MLKLHLAQIGFRLSICVRPPLLSGILCPICALNGVIIVTHHFTQHFCLKYLSPNVWSQTCSRRATGIFFFLDVILLKLVYCLMASPYVTGVLVINMSVTRKLYQTIDVSRLSRINYNRYDGTGTVTFVGDEIQAAYDNIKTFQVVLFILCDNGTLFVSRSTQSENACNVIVKYWRSYKLKTVRLKNDLALKGLAEYFGHPSRQDFSI
jgi:hypothetical protein